MKRFSMLLAGLGIAVAAVPAGAQVWQPINQRQANIDRRIEMGIRNGALNRNEAYHLRGEFRRLSQLEARYRRGGLSIGERRDLDRRFDALSARVRWERRDGGYRRYR